MVCKGQIWTTWLLCDELVVAPAGTCGVRGERNDHRVERYLQVPTTCDYKRGCAQGWSPDTPGVRIDCSSSNTEETRNQLHKLVLHSAEELSSWIFF